jgi:hypothetical protein
MNNVSIDSTYENASAQVKIEYPSDWTNYGSYGNYFIATFQGPVDKNGRPAVQILSKNIDDNIKTAKEYADTFFKNEEKTVEGYKIIAIQTDGVTLSGKPAYRAVITYNKCIENCAGKEKRAKMLEIGTIDDSGKIIAINYDAYESDFSRYLPIAQKMIDSFKLM